MNILIVITVYIATIGAVDISQSEIESQWIDFKLKYRNDGEITDEVLRRQVFESTYRYVVTHNLNADKGLHNYRVGINQFADMTVEEYKARININAKQNLTMVDSDDINEMLLPHSVDWRALGKVTAVKDQGKCGGSAFAFATVGVVESKYAINTGKLVDLSVQEVLDCYRPNWDACSLWTDHIWAIEMVKELGGLELESDYPYTSVYSKCAYSTDKVAVSITGLKALYTGNETALQAMVALQPVAASVDGSHQAFKQYKSGVHYDSACDSNNSNHPVLIVGYGTENDQDYWLVKNSWGVGWGDGGYIKMARNRGNNCAIARNVAYPTDAK